jgi:hypothetical protein
VAAASIVNQVDAAPFQMALGKDRDELEQTEHNGRVLDAAAVPEEKTQRTNINIMNRNVIADIYFACNS